MQLQYVVSIVLCVVGLLAAGIARHADFVLPYFGAAHAVAKAAFQKRRRTHHVRVPQGTCAYALPPEGDGDTDIFPSTPPSYGAVDSPRFQTGSNSAQQTLLKRHAINLAHALWRRRAQYKLDGVLAPDYDHVAAELKDLVRRKVRGNLYNKLLFEYSHLAIDSPFNLPSLLPRPDDEEELMRLVGLAEQSLGHSHQRFALSVAPTFQCDEREVKEQCVVSEKERPDDDQGEPFQMEVDNDVVWEDEEPDYCQLWWRDCILNHLNVGDNETAAFYKNFWLLLQWYVDLDGTPCSRFREAVAANRQRWQVAFCPCFPCRSDDPQHHCHRLHLRTMEEINEAKLNGSYFGERAADLACDEQALLERAFQLSMIAAAAYHSCPDVIQDDEAEIMEERLRFQNAEEVTLDDIATVVGVFAARVPEEALQPSIGVLNRVIEQVRLSPTGWFRQLSTVDDDKKTQLMLAHVASQADAVSAFRACLAKTHIYDGGFAMTVLHNITVKQNLMRGSRDSPVSTAFSTPTPLEPSAPAPPPTTLPGPLAIGEDDNDGETMPTAPVRKWTDRLKGWFSWRKRAAPVPAAAPPKWLWILRFLPNRFPFNWLSPARVRAVQAVTNHVNVDVVKRILALIGTVKLGIDLTSLPDASDPVQLLAMVSLAAVTATVNNPKNHFTEDEKRTVRALSSVCHAVNIPTCKPLPEADARVFFHGLVTIISTHTEGFAAACEDDNFRSFVLGLSLVMTAEDSTRTAGMNSINRVVAIMNQRSKGAPLYSVKFGANPDETQCQVTATIGNKTKVYTGDNVNKRVAKFVALGALVFSLGKLLTDRLFEATPAFEADSVSAICAARARRKALNCARAVDGMRHRALQFLTSLRVPDSDKELVKSFYGLTIEDFDLSAIQRSPDTPHACAVNQEIVEFCRTRCMELSDLCTHMAHISSGNEEVKQALIEKVRNAVQIHGKEYERLSDLVVKTYNGQVSRFEARGNRAMVRRRINAYADPELQHWHDKFDEAADDWVAEMTDAGGVSEGTRTRYEEAAKRLRELEGPGFQNEDVYDIFPSKDLVRLTDDVLRMMVEAVGTTHSRGPKLEAKVTRGDTFVSSFEPRVCKVSCTVKTTSGGANRRANAVLTQKGIVLPLDLFFPEKELIRNKRETSAYFYNQMKSIDATLVFALPKTTKKGFVGEYDSVTVHLNDIMRNPQTTVMGTVDYFFSRGSYFHIFALVIPIAIQPYQRWSTLCGHLGARPYRWCPRRGKSDFVTCGNMLVVNGDDQLNPVTNCRSSMTTVDKMRNPSLLRHYVNTVEGDCGSPLLWNNLFVGIHVLGCDPASLRKSNFVLYLEDTLEEVQDGYAEQLDKALQVANDTDLNNVVFENIEDPIVRELVVEHAKTEGEKKFKEKATRLNWVGSVSLRDPLPPSTRSSLPPAK